MAVHLAEWPRMGNGLWWARSKARKAKVTRSNRVGCASRNGQGKSQGAADLPIAARPRITQALFLPTLKSGITDRPFRASNHRATSKRRLPMSERLETLKKARERMTEDRDAFAKTLAAPFDRDKAERARLKFIETQVLIDAIDRAIDGEPT